MVIEGVMRQLACDARNIRHSLTRNEDGVATIETLIEAVLTLMTRKVQFSGAGLVQTEDLELVRFEMTIKTAKKLQEDIGRWIEDAESERKSLTIADPR